MKNRIVKKVLLYIYFSPVCLKYKIIVANKTNTKNFRKAIFLNNFALF